MAREGIERRLTTIMSADVVGYSRLMAGDEAGTFAQLKTHRRELFEPKATEHHGRVVKLTGDGTLMEFASVVDAVNFAVAVQQAMVVRNAGVPEDRQIRYRVGINLGEIIVDGEDIYGDGVNIAARLEGLAEPGGICISAKVYAEVRNKLSIAFEDLGEREVKNIPEPVRVYRWTDAAADPMPGTAGVEDAPPLPDKPSIAVLPFVNMSGDAEQQYFSDGITEDIITELSRFGSLAVVARTSTFVYRDQAVDVSEAGKALGAQYLVEGSLRKVGNRIRLTAQLIDVATGKHVWADRYDRQLEDIFAIQDELVHAIVATLGGRLTTADTERSLRKPPESLAAYDYYLRGVNLENRYDAESLREGQKMLQKAVDLAPEFARAYALLAWYTIMISFFYIDDAETYTAEAVELARKAIELDPDDSFGHSQMGIALLYRQEFEQACYYLDRGLALNPHDFSAWSSKALYLLFTGEPRQALDLIEEWERFEPFPPNWHWELRGLTLYGLERYEEAASALERMGTLHRWSHGYLAACYGQIGQMEKARAHWSKVVAATPDATESMIADTKLFKHQADADRLLEGLRKAGLIQ